MASSSMLHVRIDDELKTSASETLGRMGLSLSDAVRMLLRRVVDDQALPQALTATSAPTGAVREERAAFANANARNAPRHDIKELDMVRLLVEVATGDGDRLPFGSLGTVVHRYGSGRDFEVEFAEPGPAVLTLRAGEIERAWQS